MSVCHSLVCLDCKTHVILDKILSRDYGYPFGEGRGCYETDEERDYWAKRYYWLWQFMVEYLSVDHCGHHVAILDDHVFYAYRGGIDAGELAYLKDRGNYFREKFGSAEAIESLKFKDETCLWEEFQIQKAGEEEQNESTP
jgi:hypothetical protein